MGCAGDSTNVRAAVSGVVTVGAEDAYWPELARGFLVLEGSIQKERNAKGERQKAKGKEEKEKKRADARDTRQTGSPIEREGAKERVNERPGILEEDGI